MTPPPPRMVSSPFFAFGFWGVIVAGAINCSQVRTPFAFLAGVFDSSEIGGSDRIGVDSEGFAVVEQRCGFAAKLLANALERMEFTTDSGLGQRRLSGLCC